jgi:hypothetical protein
VADDVGAQGPWPRLRAALRLGARNWLVLTMSPDGGDAHGFLHRGATSHPIARAQATFDSAAAPLERVTLEVELAGGERLHLVARAVHRLPVIRVRGGAPVRLEFAACRLEGGAPAAGWCEVAGL